jgi:hypothetical protein
MKSILITMMSVLTITSFSKANSLNEESGRNLSMVAVCDHLINGRIGNPAFPVTALNLATLKFQLSSMTGKIERAEYSVGIQSGSIRYQNPSNKYTDGLIFENASLGDMEVKDDGTTVYFKSYTNQGGWGEPRTKYETWFNRKTMQLEQKATAYGQILAVTQYNYAHYTAQCRLPTANEIKCDKKGYELNSSSCD